LMLILLATVPFLVVELKEGKDFWMNLWILISIPLGASLMALLNYYQWGWISYLLLIPALVTSAYMVHKKYDMLRQV